VFNIRHERRIAMKTWLLIAMVLTELAWPAHAAAQTPKRCGDLMPPTDATKAGFAGLTVGREGTAKPDQLTCGYMARDGRTFTIEVITGPRAQTTADGYQRAASFSKGKVESVAGVGKRAWYDRSSATFWVDTGSAAVAVMMGGQEGSPGVKERLESVARVVLSHL
jgi:hypothetical protein